ncbi:hypothetical protein BHE74_00052659 [Ensete ventricosum]|uniref:Uncharacterized protein n=1 Tax=Ensete ventricosum TaxID=4639 RepID=A0A444DBS3_ENSVE|nr:hypothetical protein B296_00013615 [Ensete ventricosum]RWV95539.1 hypothetical protein GW17_00041831 [Ensete ventricosum]RWW41827.1 hypothetical protein BHE74_00052659 [Ensete ventricosum]RZR77968.1 hypothetical protein BHM03_00003187 [Ensete ventricosum]
MKKARHVKDREQSEESPRNEELVSADECGNRPNSIGWKTMFPVFDVSCEPRPHTVKPCGPPNTRLTWLESHGPSDGCLPEMDGTGLRNQKIAGLD